MELILFALIGGIMCSLILRVVIKAAKWIWQ